MYYQLIGIAERKVSIRLPAEDHPQQDYIIDWKFIPRFQFRGEDILEVDIVTVAQQSSPEENPPLLHMETAHFFKLDADIKLSAYSSPGELYQKHEMLFATLLGISLGTIRGLAYARTVGILGTDVFMPVVSPIDMVRTTFGKRKADVDNQ